MVLKKVKKNISTVRIENCIIFFISHKHIDVILSIKLNIHPFVLREQLDAAK